MTTTDIVLRLSAALITGLVLGLEREKRGRAAGLRTTTLVCVAATVAMMLSTTMPVPGSNGFFGGDPARLAAGVLAGMGFLGAGVIIRQEHEIRGVTTAATLWVASIIGLAFGSGHFLIGAAAALLTFATLVGLPPVERWLRNEAAATLVLVMQPPGLARERLEQLLAAHLLYPQSYNVTRERERIIYSVRLAAHRSENINLPGVVTAELIALPEVLSAEWRI